MISTNTILEGRHPYTGTPTTLEVQVLAEVPGEITGISEAARQARERVGAWVALAGPFHIDTEGEVHESDRQSLLGLCWDLMGLPLRPGGRHRTLATHCVVADDRGHLTVYRLAAECSDAHSLEAEATQNAGLGIRNVAAV